MAFQYIILLSALALFAFDPYVSASVQRVFSDDAVEEDYLEGDYQEGITDYLPFNCTTYSDEHYAECCGDIKVPSIKIDKKGCLKLTYIGERTSIEVSLSIDGKERVKYELSGHNPPPMCVHFPFTKLFADICIKLKQLAITREYVHTCMELEPRLFLKSVTTIDAGCVNMTLTDSGEETSNEKYFF